ncbi:MAG: hypothetical protein ACXABU_09560, partial [Candidatus Hodarchaeales archaeon]
WLVQVSVFDGEVWSASKNTTYALRIVNSDSILSNLHFEFNTDFDFVDPQTRVNEFYVETEDINISYDYFDYDNDPENIIIRWYVQYSNGTVVEVYQYENASIIPAYETSPGEKWWASVTTYDEMIEGMNITSSKINIVFHPNIGDLTKEPGSTNDGEYNLTVQILNYNVSENIVVEFQFPGNVVYYGIPTGNGYWHQSINLTEDIGTNITLTITISMSISGTSFFVVSEEIYNILIEDLTSPRAFALDVDNAIELDDSNRPTNITFYIGIIENNAEIAEVLMFYTILDLSSSSLGTGASINEVGPIIMTFFGYKENLQIYSGSITNLELTTAIKLHIRVQTRDSLNNTNPSAFEGNFTIPYNPKNQDFAGPLVVAILGMFAFFLAVSVSYFIYQRRKDKTSSEKRSIEDKLAFLTDTYTILVTSAAGVPIWNISNIIYKADESLTGTLSGLSVGIDAFLESFQEDFIAQMSDISLSRDHPEAETTYRLSVIEQNKIQIMILGSASYRIFAFLKEIPSSFLRNTFLKAIKDLQHNLPLYDTGIINESLLGPNIRRTLRKHLPIGLLEPFKIDLERLAYFDSLHRQKIEDTVLSKGAISVLKFLVVTSLTPPTTSSTKQALLKLYDQSISDHSRRHSGILLYSDVMKLLSQVGGFALKDVSEALWMGIDDRVKILIPF